MPRSQSRDAGAGTSLPAPLRVLRWVVVWIALSDLVLLSRPPYYGIEPWIFVGVSAFGSAAIVAALFRPGAGFLLSLVPIASAFVVGPFGQTILPVLTVTVAVCATARGPLVGTVLAAYLASTLSLGLIVSPNGLTIRTFVPLAASACVGFAARALLARHRRVGSRIRALEKRTAQLKADERRALAEELSALLVAGLSGHDAQVAQGRNAPDAATLAGALETVERGARDALAQLRGLVSTLRGRAAPSGHASPVPAPDLIAVAEELDDLLTGHGHLVEVRVPTDAVGVRDFARRLLGDVLRESGVLVVAAAPAAAPCLVALTSTPDGATVEVSCSGEEPSVRECAEPPGLRDACERLRAAGGTVEVTRDGGWQLRASMPTTISLDEARPPETAAAAETPPTRRWTPRRGLYWSCVVALATYLLVALRINEPTVTLGLPHAAAVGVAALLVARNPRWVGAAAIGWVAYTAAWFDSFDPETLALSVFAPLLGAVLGVSARHFLDLRARQRSRLGDAHRYHARARDDVRKELAGELHDIVAHQLTLITLQGNARHGDRDPAALRAALDRVATILHSTQADLALLLHVLRAPRTGARPAASATAPEGEPDAHALFTPVRAAEAAASTVRESGRTVDLRVDAAVDEADPTTRATLTRIIREGATNILRYAPAGAGCVLLLETQAGGVHILLTNPMPERGRRSEHSTGLGLVGLGERVRLTGGTLTAGPAAGRWVLEATLPPMAEADLAPDEETVSPAPAGASRHRRSRAGSSGRAPVCVT